MKTNSYTISADVNARINFNDIEIDDLLKLSVDSKEDVKQKKSIEDTDEL